MASPCHQERATCPALSDKVAPISSSSADVSINKWKNFGLRAVFGLAMIVTFIYIVLKGPIYMCILVITLQILVYYEVIRTGFVVYKARDLPWMRTLSWVVLLSFITHYFLFGESFIGYFRILLKKGDFLTFFVDHHRFICFSLYCITVVGFVLSLRKRYSSTQFTLFGYTHVSLLLIATSANFILQCIFLGIFWFFLPCSMVIANDIFAYLIGCFFGRTPLIKVSPKKTWEGFIGSALCTTIWSLLAASVLIQFDYFVCPLQYNDELQALSMECVRNPIFVAKMYETPQWMHVFSPPKVLIYPALFHVTTLSLFASLVGPFGGFFASGFKRAFNLKDFSNLIPGHGGMTDRFDCQYLMGAFTYVYYHSFIKPTDSVNSLLKEVFLLPQNDQLKLYQTLTDGLIRRGILALP